METINRIQRNLADFVKSAYHVSTGAVEHALAETVIMVSGKGEGMRQRVDYHFDTMKQMPSNIGKELGTMVGWYGTGAVGLVSFGIALNASAKYFAEVMEKIL